MLVYVIAYFGAAVAFCALDFLWLTVVAKNFYQSHIGSLMLAEPKLLPAAAFYIIYVFGLLVFAIVPALRAQNWFIAAGLAGLLGLIAYSCYDLSNFATLNGWSLSLTLVDITWGIFASAVAGTAGYFAARFYTNL